MEQTQARAKIASQIHHMVAAAVIKNRRFLEDEQLIKAEQLAVLEEIFNTNVRDAEIKELSSHFAPIFRQDHPCHVAIWGKTGTGKTLTLTYFLTLLTEMAAAKQVPVRSIHLDLSNPRPCFRALNDLACLLDASKRHEKGISLEEMMFCIERKLADYRGYFVLFIDEVDNVTDAFMKQLDDHPAAPHIVVNPRPGKRYAIPHAVQVSSYTLDDLLDEDQAHGTDCYTAQDLWNMVVESAWTTGEPGICFIDRINRCNPTPQLGSIEARNPCGEQPLLPYEACNLGSIDVSKLVDQDGKELDWHSLGEAVKLSVRFLDNVIDANYYPVPEIRKVTLANRKIGLGIMGFADALILLGIPYTGEEAVGFVVRLASFIQDHAHAASEELAKEKGSFPNWHGSIWDTRHHRPMRNATCTTMAPTGTISILADCSSGIEPIFSFVSRRKVLDGEEFIQLHPLIDRLAARGQLTNEVRGLLAEGIPPGEIAQVPKTLAQAMVIAHDVSPQWHVRMQAAFQKHTDNAVSKTVNLPAKTSITDADEVYRLAFAFGCKGITVYRDGSRANQVLTALHKTEVPPAGIPLPRPRPNKTTGSTIKKRTGCGSLYVTINHDEEGLIEIFTNLGKAGGCPSQSEATARVVSLALRSGVNPQVLIAQLKGIRCLSTVARKRENRAIDVLSCPDAMARAIEEAMGQSAEPGTPSAANPCPDCSYPLRTEAGCNVCDNGGFSKCG